MVTKKELADMAALTNSLEVTLTKTLLRHTDVMNEQDHIHNELERLRWRLAEIDGTLKELMNKAEENAG